MTVATEKAYEFLYREDDQISTLEDALLDPVVGYYSGLIEDSVQSLTEVRSFLQVFQIEQPVRGAEATRDQHAKLRAWHEYMHAQGEDFLNRYYNAVPFSPFYENEVSFNKAIRKGQREESDKEVWEIIFMHPDGSHFYQVKSMPGEGGVGWGYRISVSNNFDWYNNALKSVARGERYSPVRDQIEP